MQGIRSGFRAAGGVIIWSCGCDRGEIFLQWAGVCLPNETVFDFPSYIIALGGLRGLPRGHGRVLLDRSIPRFERLRILGPTVSGLMKALRCRTTFLTTAAKSCSSTSGSTPA